MSARERIGDRFIGMREVDDVPIYVQGNGDYRIPAVGADLPGSRLPDANVRCLNWTEDGILAEAVVRLDHPGYIVNAWAEGADAMHSLRAAVRSLVESEKALIA